MTIEQLLDLPPEGLEALSNEELCDMLSPYFRFSRPATPLTALSSGTVMRPGASVGRGVSQKTQMSLVMDKIMNSTDLTPEKLEALRSLVRK